jgi:hypothetical protein
VLEQVTQAFTIIQVNTGYPKIEVLIADKSDKIIIPGAKGFLVHFLTKNLYLGCAVLFVPFGDDNVYILNKPIPYLF